jgi:hypothetical protein
MRMICETTGKFRTILVKEWCLDQAIKMWSWLAETGEENKYSYFNAHKIAVGDIPKCGCYLCEIDHMNCSECETFAEEWEMCKSGDLPCWLTGSPYYDWEDASIEIGYTKEERKKRKQAAAWELVKRMKAVRIKMEEHS